MTRLALTAALFASLAACATETPSDDLEGSIFGEDGKEDAPIAGVRENTFEAFGVLNAAASLDEAGWKTVAGATAAKAKKLAKAQETSGWGKVGLPSLKALTKAGATTAMITKLKAYATEHHLTPTAAIKLPVQQEDGTYLWTLNDQLRDKHVPFFTKYMYIWDGAAGDAQYLFYDSLDERATDAGVDAEMFVGASLYAGDGNDPICYIGNQQTAELAVRAGIGVAFSEQLQISAVRAGSEKSFLDGYTEEDILSWLDDDTKAAWESYDTASSEVLFLDTASDGGDDVGVETIDRCD